jgi:hypothetical protein
VDRGRVIEGDWDIPGVSARGNVAPNATDASIVGSSTGEPPPLTVARNSAYTRAFGAPTVCGTLDEDRDVRDDLVVQAVMVERPLGARLQRRHGWRSIR